MKNTPNKLYESLIFESDENYVNIKEVYTFVDCLSDLGGLIEIIMVFAYMVMNPISYHSYILKAI